MVQTQGCKKGQITQEERVKIYGYIQLNLSLREMGRRLGRQHTSISKEIDRNSIDKGRGIIKYCPIKAENMRLERRYKANQKHIILRKDNKQRKLLENLLKEKGSSWGVDEIIGRINIEFGTKTISTSTFYRFIREYNPMLQRYLRFKQYGYKTVHKGNKRKKMYQDVPNIKDRAEIINQRGRIGDFEGDTIVSGHKYKGGLMSLVDRKARYYLLKKIGNLKAGTINMTIKSMLNGEKIESITFDNGVEFSKIKELHRQCYRADPYSSWQRGTNERHNGFVRRFIPKGVNINGRTDEEIQNIQDMINHKPRKILGYKTPYEVYYNTSKKYIN
ncbi:MAG TPA: IS30 family transposase [Candidatus Absconditabacterales bacterium]|nr:IS30 family transposase [Candidatus Absconditabacterales bacterium]HRU50208.1 IS30 family transposase [Candidatus Absconditabacterales bacterium]